MIFTPTTVAATPRIRLYNSAGANGIAVDQYMAFDDLRVEEITGAYAGFYNNAKLTASKSYGPCENMGVAVTNFTSGSVVPFRFHAVNGETNVSIVSALYTYVGGEKKIANVTSETIAPMVVVGDSRDVGFKGNITIPQLEAGKTYYLEAYVWDSLTGMKPLISKQIIRN